MKKHLAVLLALSLFGCNSEKSADDDKAVHSVGPVEKTVVPAAPERVSKPDEKPKDSGPVFSSEGYENQEIPPRARTYMSNLYHAMRELEFPERYPQSLAGQIEQETCYSFKHKFCWNPNTEIKNHREYGFGIGQITIAYREDGSERFNVFDELKQYKELADWKWEERFNVDYQMRALVIKMRVTCSMLKFETINYYNKLAFCFAGYNGGVGGVLSDRRICISTPGCEPDRWFDGVEATSNKSKKPMSIYGNKSIFQINREYPKNILEKRMHKYLWYLEGIGEYP